MSVLVFANAAQGKITKASQEAVFYGKQIANALSTDVTAVTYGEIGEDELSNLGKFGASKVLVNKGLTETNDQSLTQLVAKAAEAEGAKVVVFSFDIIGKSVAPRLSARLKAGLISAATSLPVIDGNKFTVAKNVFSGKAIAHISAETDIKVISLLPNSFQPAATDGSATVEEFNPEISAGRLKVESFKPTGGEGILLTEAELVVSAGRGLKGPENWGIVEELATELGAATACSRPVADIGWRPHHEHVGQTGIAIRPNLYIAAGISGAIQHLAGVNGSKTIVVINTDPEAPFFKAADYGVVGDAFEVLPRLTEAVKKFKATN